MIDWNQIKHFARKEFGHAPGVEPDEALVLMLDDAREIAGIPFHITSALRSREDNLRVGGARDSAHLTGHAVDLRAPTSRIRSQMLRALLAVGFNRIGIYPGHIHVDTSPGLPQDVVWLGGGGND